MDTLPLDSPPVEYKPHDALAKLVMKVLAPHREQIPEAELRLPVYGDILLRPGPLLPEACGLLRTLIGEGLALLEYFSARPRLLELMRIRAKGFMGVGLELERERDFALLEKSRIIIVANGMARRALKRAWWGRKWVEAGPGICVAPVEPETYYIDLLRLPVTLETAWQHVSGKSLWVNEALELLSSSGDKVNQAYLTRLSEEVPQMEVRVDRGEELATRRFLSAWEELSAVRRGEARGLQVGRDEGRKEGHKEGRDEAYHAMLSLLLTQRFGDAAAPVMNRLKGVTEQAALEAVAIRLLQVSSLDELTLPEP